MKVDDRVEISPDRTDQPWASGVVTAVSPVTGMIEVKSPAGRLWYESSEVRLVAK